MSLYGTNAGLKKLEKELAEKKSRYQKLSETSLLESLFLTESDWNATLQVGPLWRDLHLKRNAMVFQ